MPLALPDAPAWARRALMALALYAGALATPQTPGHGVAAAAGVALLGARALWARHLGAAAALAYGACAWAAGLYVLMRTGWQAEAHAAGHLGAAAAAAGLALGGRAPRLRWVVLACALATAFCHARGRRTGTAAHEEAGAAMARLARAAAAGAPQAPPQAVALALRHQVDLNTLRGLCGPHAAHACPSGHAASVCAALREPLAEQGAAQLMHRARTAVPSEQAELCWVAAQLAAEAGDDATMGQALRGAGPGAQALTQWLWGERGAPQKRPTPSHAADLPLQTVWHPGLLGLRLDDVPGTLTWTALAPTGQGAILARSPYRTALVTWVQLPAWERAPMGVHACLRGLPGCQVVLTGDRGEARAPCEAPNPAPPVAGCSPGFVAVHLSLVPGGGPCTAVRIEGEYLLAAWTWLAGAPP